MKAITVVPCFIAPASRVTFPAPLHFLASFVGVIHCDGDVAEGVAELVLVHAQLWVSSITAVSGFVAVNDEGQGEFALR